MTRHRTAAVFAIALVWLLLCFPHASNGSEPSPRPSPRVPGEGEPQSWGTSPPHSSRRRAKPVAQAAADEPPAVFTQPRGAPPGESPSPSPETWPGGDAAAYEPHAGPSAGEYGCPDCGGRHRAFGGCRHPWPLFGVGADLGQRFNQPLERASWLYRPLSAGIFTGVVFGDSLISGKVDQDSGVFGGLRLGWDLEANWGIESRFAMGTIEIIDQRSAEQLQENDPMLWDTSLLYYPWGETRWRPFLTFGAGLANHSFVNDQGQQFNSLVFGLPFGVGLKYRLTDRLAARGELVDNFTFAGSGIDAMHNLSLTAGLELRFGGRRISYFPWNPGRRQL